MEKINSILRMLETPSYTNENMSNIQLTSVQNSSLQQLSLFFFPSPILYDL